MNNIEVGISPIGAFDFSSIIFLIELPLIFIWLSPKVFFESNTLENAILLRNTFIYIVCLTSIISIFLLVLSNLIFPVIIHFFLIAKQWWLIFDKKPWPISMFLATKPVGVPCCNIVMRFLITMVDNKKVSFCYFLVVISVWNILVWCFAMFFSIVTQQFSK